MKTKILSVAMAIALGMFATSCSDDEDYSPASGQLISSVQTGSSDATANSAVLSGTVEGLGSQAAFSAGFYYGFSEDALTEQVSGSVTGNTITATVNGLSDGQTIYYQAYVILQGKVAYKGEVKSFTTSATKVATSDAASISKSSAVLKATATDNPANAECGFVISTDKDNVKNGLVVLGKEEGGSISLTKAGLLPNTTYYYAGFVDLGANKVYGDVKSFTTESYKASMDDLVDLGLSVMWMSCNVGATTPSEMGGLFGYGEISGCKNSTDVADYTPVEDITGTDKDIATLAYGDLVFTPTVDQMEELFTLCEKEWTEMDGVPGMKFTGPNGNSIFLPAAGSRTGNSINKMEEQGVYSTGTAKDSQFANAYQFTASSQSKTVAPVFQALSIRAVSKGVRNLTFSDADQSKLVYGHIETDKNNFRIEIYNQFGSTANGSIIDPSKISFSKNMVVTFKLTGIDDNLKEGATAGFVAGIEYADANWGHDRWAGLESVEKYDAYITGDGTYSVWHEVSEDANGAVVFCVDINMVSSIADISKVKAELVSIKYDIKNEQAPNNEISAKLQNKDGNNVDGRIEIYNEYGVGGGAANGFYNETLKFNGMCIVDFEIEGIDGNLVDGAAGSYTGDMSFADASWDPSSWGGQPFGQANIKGDGQYTAYAYLKGDCDGAVVWVIDIPNLWKDLKGEKDADGNWVPASLPSIKINKIITPNTL